MVLFLLIAGCGSLEIPLMPTVAASAAAPNFPNSGVWRLAPATYTAAAAPVWAVTAGIATSEPTVKPTPTLRITHTPSPVPVVPVQYRPRDAGAPFVDSPPESVPCDGQGFFFRSRFPSGVGGSWREYHAYLPPCYGHDGRVYPVVYLIHGSVQNDSHWLDLGLARVADDGIANGQYPPFIAIMPNSGQLGNVSSGGDNSIEGITVDYLMPFVDNYYCTWNDKPGRSIGGISRGGYWALEIAFRNFDLFSSVSGHSSHLRYETDTAKYNPLATYATADLSNMRIWLDRGETDFLRVGQEQLHESLSEALIRHEYLINPGGHSDTYWATYLKDYIDWHTEEWPRERDAYPSCRTQIG